ncbi:unnamed protein product, partial [Mesorhabditis spiculigera]
MSFEEKEVSNTNKVPNVWALIRSFIIALVLSNALRGFLPTKPLYTPKVFEALVVNDAFPILRKIEKDPIYPFHICILFFGIEYRGEGKDEFDARIFQMLEKRMELIELAARLQYRSLRKLMKIDQYLALCLLAFNAGFSPQPQKPPNRTKLFEALLLDFVFRLNRQILQKLTDWEECFNHIFDPDFQYDSDEDVQDDEDDDLEDFVNV